MGEDGPTHRGGGCSYMRVGACGTYGTGAKKYWKPVSITIEKYDGSKIKRMRRKPFSSCDLAPSGRER